MNKKLFAAIIIIASFAAVLTSGCTEKDFSDLVIAAENVSDVPEGEYYLPYTINDYSYFDEKYNLDLSVTVFDQANNKVEVNNNRSITVKNDNVYTLINVDFTKPEVRAFQALEDFVIKQDEPVVIIGRFGEPAWGKLMKELLQKTGLQVKNRMVLISNSSSFSLFHAPDFYALGFDNIGISDLETSYNTNTEKPVVMMELSYY